MPRCSYHVAFLCLLVVDAILLIDCIDVNSAYASDCNTPDGYSGKCMPYSSCSDIEHIFLTAEKTGEHLSPKNVSYLKKAVCDEYDYVRHFCCANNKIQHNSKVMQLLESEDFNCGTIINQRVAYGHEVELSSKPWMALLHYKSYGEPRFRCAGTLIASRYILTAAQCVYGLEDQLYEVRLGEHRISTERDCRQQGRKEKCAPPVKVVGIEKFLLHEKYDSQSYLNDIALLRMNSSVTFEKHIKPICLPITDELKKQAEKLPNYFVTGWGSTENGSTSDVLLQVSLLMQPRSVCSREYGNDVPDTQLCVGGSDLQKSCKGDSGGPLQAPVRYLNEYNLRMVEFGIESLGPQWCEPKRLPGLYTNVAHYMQWITDTMARHGL